jgi:hypothetical protein
MANGPWPEDEVDTGSVGDPDGATGRGGPPDRFDDEAVDTPAGSKGVSLAIAGVSVTFPVLLPWLLVIGIYVFLTIYALVKATGSAPDEPNATVVVIGIVGLVTGLLLVFAAGVSLLGRAANPKKRRR